MFKAMSFCCKFFGRPMVRRSLPTRQLRTSNLNMVYNKEPEYLKLLKPPVPVYEILNIQIKGYDFTVLERYARHVHRLALHMDIDVENAWATPHQAFTITNFEPNSSKVANEYMLKIYERNVQIINAPAYSAPLFFEVIQSSLPEGVSISVHPHEIDHNEIRYIPDFELNALKDQLEIMITENELRIEALKEVPVINQLTSDKKKKK